MAKRVSGAPTSALVLDGKSSPKRRGTSGRSITDTQLETFFVTLTETCNVARSARAAGFNAATAYRRRKTDAGFRKAWAEAVREGYAKLELVLLERVIKGTPKPMFRKDGSVRIIREYSTALAVTLLKRHADLADSAGHEPAGEELAEIRARILERLDKLRDLDAGPGIETKSAGRRPEWLSALVARHG